MKLQKWNIEKRKLDDLKDHPDNPREFTEKGLQDLEASLKSIGIVDLIAINKDGTILSGHARKKKLLELGEVEVSVLVPPKQLSAKKAREVLIRMNKNTAGAWDMIKLGEFEQQDLIEYGFEKSDFNNFPSGGGDKKVTDTKGFFVLLEFDAEKDQEAFFNEMNKRGMKCKLMS